MMPSEPTITDTETNSTAAVTVCPACRAQMPREMRFCRACGFRLGEGVAEFTETVRLPKFPTGTTQPARSTRDETRRATAASSKPNPFGSIQDWSAIARNIQQSTIKGTAKLRERQQRKQGRCSRGRFRSNWMTWIILISVISIFSGGRFMSASDWRNLRDSLRGASSGHVASRSWVGTSDLKTVDGGVTFEQVEPAGSPADKAGLVGGDLVTTFDGQAVKSAGELMKLLAVTPVGKSVNVVYVRDGETKTTKLVTVSEDEIDRLGEQADAKTDGYVGIGSNRERVLVPGTNIYGIQLNSVRRNNPLYIAGIKDGDIVIAFDGVPIRTDDELNARTRRAVPDSTVKVVVMRGSERLEIPVKVGVDD
jgi:hypothetical protein